MAALNKQKLVLTIEYDGTGYRGSQAQRHGATIQSELETALEKLAGTKIRVHLAGRTDAGVSATGQVVSFRTELDLPLETVATALNHFLPAEIAVLGVYRVPEEFDVRRHAVSREYCYHIWHSPVPSPLRERYSYRVYGELDLSAMNQAAAMLVGNHDMAAFASRLGKKAGSTIRRVDAAEVVRQDAEITFRIKAASFLPHQVRNIVGSLIKVGQGKMTLDEFSELMTAAVPGSAGPAVPGKGLCLISVNYVKDLGDYNENL
ncbi:MAG: tRNA pseudouridine(38-40) synthase TruA [Dehalogenimonas sp.]|uniref:tRNA pseudouridine synthase A n=1 Tax=Candidatus Dehalogenimonas loeffleri TaxID=3127115 RepID=A0ABZ2J7X2_9CHLR|nr:tRNA pseudouridine(38-40) synthase TruA [Dehalogenimonas sp.]